jgi:hypothetical protein
LSSGHAARPQTFHSRRHGQPELEPAQIATIIESDLGTTTYLLQVANSRSQPASVCSTPPSAVRQSSERAYSIDRHYDDDAPVAASKRRARSTIQGILNRLTAALAKARNERSSHGWTARLSGITTATPAAARVLLSAGLAALATLFAGVGLYGVLA